MESILRLLACVLAWIYSKTLMRIPRALNHPLVLMRMQCCHWQWHAIITGWNQLQCLSQKRNAAKLTRKRLLHPSSRNIVLEMIIILYVQWTGMRQLVNCLLTSLKPYFITSLQGIYIISMFIHLLVKKSTRDLWRIENCAGITMDIMIRQWMKL